LTEGSIAGDDGDKGLRCQKTTQHARRGGTILSLEDIIGFLKPFLSPDVKDSILSLDFHPQ
jgi:hypothetical protein